MCAFPQVFFKKSGAAHIDVTVFLNGFFQKGHAGVNNLFMFFRKIRQAINKFHQGPDNGFFEFLINAGR